MPYLDAAAILAAMDQHTIEVDCPEWGGPVLIGSMGALARARLDDWIETLGRNPKPPDSDRSTDSPDSAGGEPIACDDASPPEDLQTEEGKPRPMRSGASGQSAASPPTVPSARREYSSEENTAVMVRWCSECILDPKTRRRAFPVDQIEALGEKSPTILLRIYRAALEINLATKAAAEEFEKNSEGTSGGGSGGD
jgi:hypothetical protein